MNTKLAQMREQKRLLKNNYCRLVGGNAALDFVNTVRFRGSDNYQDDIKNYEALVYWCHLAGIISYDHYSKLSLDGYCYEHESTAVFGEADMLRMVLHGLFLSVMAGIEADELDLHYFNKVIGAGAAFLRYESTGRGIERVWFNIGEQLAAPLWIIAESAAELLLNSKQHKIKQCPTCGSLFVDGTKNGTRRWCSPLACGGVLKAKAYYHAKKKLLEHEILA